MIRVILIAVLLFAAGLQAQTPQLTWNAPDNTQTATEAQGLIYTLYVNGGTGVVVSGVTCTGSVPSACSAPVPTGTPTAIGTKLELTAKTATSEESARSIPFSTPPTAPSNLRKR